MNQEIKEQWVTALTSREYKQGAGKLHTVEDDYEIERFCCLGVLCDLAVKAGAIPPPRRRGSAFYYGDDEGTSTNYLPPTVLTWAGIALGTGAEERETRDLANLNDSGYGFGYIAAQIRERL